MAPSASPAPGLAAVCAEAACFGSGGFGALLDFLPMGVLLVKTVRPPCFRGQRRNDAVLVAAEEARTPHLREAIVPGNAQRRSEARRRARDRELAAELVEDIG